MKTQIFLAAITILTAIGSCEKQKSENPDSAIILKSSLEEYSQINQNRSLESSDPFNLIDITTEGEKVKISVSYTGGCIKHSFEIIWNEDLESTNPPEIAIILVHNSNGDQCEEFVTEELSFSLNELVGNLSANNLTIFVSSGYNPEDMEEGDGEKYPFTIEESDICNMEVTAKSAICGYGLYGSLWFAMNDSISSGVEGYYYKKFLHPVAVVDALKEFEPVDGQKYKIGVRIEENFEPADLYMCLAYPGPSVPVRIMCIEPKRE